MMRSLRARSSCAFALIFLGLFSCTHSALAQINSDWNVAAGNWNVGGNWSPVGVPNNSGLTTYNVQIGNIVPSNAQVTFIPLSGTSASISNLTISNGADLFTSSNQLTVLTQTTVNGAGSTIRVDPHTTPGTVAFQTVDLDLNSGGALSMAGGIALIGSLMEVNAGSVLGGNGTVNVGNTDVVATIGFENSGLIQVTSNTIAPQTLTIHANGVDTIDLDGATELGTVDVDNAVGNLNLDTTTLVVDGPLADAFSSTVQIGQRDTLTFTKNFTISGAAVQMTGGNDLATLNGAGNITSIASTALTVSGAARIDNGMTFTGTANTITVGANSSLTLGGTVSIPDASAVSLTSTSELIISGNTTITEAAGDFNWDGPGVATTTVKGAGQLSLTVNRVDTTDDVYGGTLNLVDNGDVSVDNVANVWTMAGTVHKSGIGTSTIGGDAVNVTGNVTVDAGGQLSTGTMTLSPGANVIVNGTLVPGIGSVLAGPTSLTGTGTLRMASTSTVSANTQIGVSTFDWDGLTAGSLQTINNGVVFTISSTTFDSDGDMDDPISLGGNGAQLVLNGVTDWTMAAALTTNAADIGTATIGGTARMTLTGASATWNVSGNTNATAPVTFGTSSVTTIAAGKTLRLDSGGFGSDANVMAGGTINGPGTLAANTGRGLRGFGTVGAPVDFDGTAAIFADNGTLTINGAITDVGTIGTTGVTPGTLNIPAAWNSSIADFVNMNGGTLQGGTITVANSNGISGRGMVTSRVINNTRLSATTFGQSLIFQTAANDNDWDGAGNIGLLEATNGGTLEVRDNATFAYGGTVTVTGASRVYANGFGLTFATTSAINLTASTLQTDETSSFSGPIVVGAGADSTINLQVNRFLDINSTSTVALNGNLRLVSNNASIKAGVTFSGSGAVIVPAGSHLVPEANANINALLVNQGTIRPAGFDIVGAVTLKDYQQTDSGQLFVELTGTLLNQIDRFAVTGVAQLDGYLNIDIDGGFVPALGNVFNIISAPGGVAGTFDTVDVSGMPAGLTFHVTYLPTLVQLKVVSTSFFAADFDDDGDVDLTDYNIWRAAFNLNQLGDATGDNISDSRDYVIWRKQLGSHAGAGAGAGLADVDGASVPEPGALGLLAVAMLSISLIRETAQTRLRG